MSLSDLHPESLLERAASGELDDRERELLNGHLARCQACRFELEVRRDFAEEMSSYAGLLGPRLADPLSRSRRASPPRPPRERARWRFAARAAWGAAAAAVLAVGVALASSSVGGWRAHSSRLPLLDQVVERRIDSTVERTRVSNEAGGMTPIPVESSAIESVPKAREGESAPKDGSRRGVLVDKRAPPSPASLEPTARVIFEREIAARQRGDYALVLSLHRELETRFGLTQEAQVSRATTGRLSLDRGDLDAALACFDAYLALGSGELGEEVMVGRATALERSGQSDEARAAWRRLLEAYPSTPYATHARARLGI